MSHICIIGERLNSTAEEVRRILRDRDAGALLELARKQADGGASVLDINASMLMDDEEEAAVWAAGTITAALSIPIAFDSPSTGVLLRSISRFGGDAFCNSLTCDDAVLEEGLPAIAEAGAGVFIMLKSAGGMPDTAGGRIALAERAVSRCERAGIPPERVYLDPLFSPLATTQGGLAIVLETLAFLRERFPACNRIGGLSNISFGLPMRRLLNRTFLAMAVPAGLTAVICDSTDERLMETIKAAEALTGLDPGCRDLLGYHRNR